MKKYLGFLFKGLVSNQELIDGRKHKFWGALIVALISLIIAVIPTCVTLATSKGSSCLTSSSNCSLDTSLTLLSKKLKEENITFRVDSEGKLVTSLSDDASTTDVAEDEILISVDDDGTTRNLLLVGYKPGEAAQEEFKEKAYEYNLVTNDDGTKTNGPVSYLLVTDTNFYIVTYANGSTNSYKSDGSRKSVASSSSTYTGVISGIKDTDFSSFYTDEVGGKAACVNAWKNALNKMYNPVKKASTILYSLIITGLNFGVIIIVTLMIFLVAKLKSNQGVKFTFLESVTVAGYASLAPALLTLILGFMISYLSMIGFVLFLGLRSTFIGIKATAPQEKK